MTADAITAPKPQGQGRLALYLGLALGIAAAVLVAMILNSGTKDEVVVPATRIAITAAADIPARQRITADMLKVEVFELKNVNPDAFSATSQVVNRVTAEEIKAGTIIVPAQVSQTIGTGLPFTLQPGMRALSIGVKEVVTAGGNIVPGNYVDIIAEFDIKPGSDLNFMIAALFGEQPPPGPPITAGSPTLSGGSDRKMIITLLQNVKVLAVAQVLPAQQAPAPKAATNDSGTQSTGGSAPAAPQNPNPKASTVTLEVTPQAAQILVLADQNGTLRLTMRPFSEDKHVPLPPFIIAVE